jgi:hypothetical protein
MTRGLALGLVLGLIAGGVLLGDAQERGAADRAWDELATRELKAEKSAAEALPGKAQSTRSDILAVSDAYKTATASPEALRGAVARSLHHYYGQKMAARGAAQASQLAAESHLRLAALQIYQNERIIGLLEEIRKR